MSSAEKPRRLTFPERLSHRLAMRRRKWTSGDWRLKQNNIFIFPNRFGFYAGFLVLASFAMGYKVQNNFILLGVIFLFLVFMLSLIAGVRNLQGIEISVSVPPYQYAGQAHYMRFSFKKAQPAFNVWLETPVDKIQLDLSTGATSVSLPIGDYHRGVYPLPAFKLSTVFPFGIARVWSWLRPPGELVVAPKPHELSATQYPRGNPMMADMADAKRQQNDYADELGDLRDYGESDPPARIDWKRFAATRETMVREHGFDAQGEIVLRQPQGDFEAGLQYLSGGLRMAEKLGAPARMTLNGVDYTVYDKPAREVAYHVLARSEG